MRPSGRVAGAGVTYTHLVEHLGLQPVHTKTTSCIKTKAYAHRKNHILLCWRQDMMPSALWSIALWPIDRITIAAVLHTLCGHWMTGKVARQMWSKQQIRQTEEEGTVRHWLANIHTRTDRADGCRTGPLLAWRPLLLFSCLMAHSNFEALCRSTTPLFSCLVASSCLMLWTATWQPRARLLK